jgi:hypothetical protein
MKYIIIDKAMLQRIGIRLAGHRTNGNLVLLNEKELMSVPGMDGNTVDERAKKIGGTVYSHDAIMHELKQGGGGFKSW